MADLIKIRRDTEDVWNSVNPVLAEGEIGLILKDNGTEFTDPIQFKVGNGSGSWSSLPLQKANTINEIKVNGLPIALDSGSVNIMIAVSGSYTTASSTVALADTQGHLIDSYITISTTPTSSSASIMRSDAVAALVNSKQDAHIQLSEVEFTYIEDGKWYDADGEVSSICAPSDAVSTVISCFVFNPTNSVAELDCFKESGDFGSDVTAIRLAPLEYIKLTANVDSSRRATWTWESASGISFINPVGPWKPDPCFWKADDGYSYIKGTGRTNTVLRTRNFVDYEDTGRTFITGEAQEELFNLYGHYATDDSTYKLHPNYWAPFVIKIGSNWVMYLAVVERTGTKSEPVNGAAHIVAFTSKTPYGGFENPVTVVSDGDFNITNTVVWNNVIDPFVYYDSKVNKLYLVAGSSYSIGCVELTEDGLSTVLPKGVGNKATRLGGLTINSDPNRWAVYEGAYVYARPYNGQIYYYLFASMGDWTTRDYAVIVGRSLNSNNGSYVDRSGTNLIMGNKSVSLARRILSTESETSTFWGPGHVGGIFETEDGKTWMLYHCHDGDGEQDRKLFIQELLWDEDGWPYFENNGHPVLEGTISKGIITDTPHICYKEVQSVLTSGVLNLVEDTTSENLVVTLQLKNEQGKVVEEKTETVEPENSVEMELTLAEFRTLQAPFCNITSSNLIDANTGEKLNMQDGWIFDGGGTTMAFGGTYGIYNLRNGIEYEQATLYISIEQGILRVELSAWDPIV